MKYSVKTMYSIQITPWIHSNKLLLKHTAPTFHSVAELKVGVNDLEDFEKIF